MADRIGAIITSFIALAVVTDVLVHAGGATQVEGGFFGGLTSLTKASLGNK